MERNKSNKQMKRDRKIYKLLLDKKGTMLEVWRKQFTTSRLSLTHEDPTIFAISQWQQKTTPSKWYLVYRIFMSLFLISAWILSIVDERNLDKPYMFRVKWVIYLTNWGFSLCTLQSILCTCMLINKMLKGADSENNNRSDSNVYKLYWATNIIATDSSIAITILYWTIIFDPETMPLDYLNLLVHACNSLCMFIEFWVVAHPVKIFHSYLSFLFGFTYTVFTIIYHFAGGTSRDDEPTIYKVINWNKPLPTFAICFGAMIFLVIIHCLSYGLYRLKVWLSKKCMGINYNNNNQAKTQLPIQEIFRGFDNEGLTTETA